jgi:hypothetical protein
VATSAEVRRMMLVHLGVIDPVENPSAELASLADLWITAARGMLLETGLCWWDEDAVPDAVLTPFVRYAGALSPQSFGRGGKGFESYEIPSRQQLAALKSSEERGDVRGEYS